MWRTKETAPSSTRSAVRVVGSTLATFFWRRLRSQLRAIGDAWLHMFGNVTAVIIELINLVLRWGHPEAALPSPGVYLSGAAVLLLAFTGWKGGNLVFRHRVGVLGGEDAAI